MKRIVVKVTKAQLLEAVHCRRDYNHKLIKTHWPKRRRKVTLIEFVKRAREKRVSYSDIQYVLWRLDFDGWEEIGEGEDINTTAGCRNVVNKYLELFGAKGG